MLRRVHHDDDGQLLLLVLCYTVIAGLLVTVVVNLSQAYLYRRSLVAAADAAALSAANQPDLDEIYSPSSRRPRSPVLPLAEAAAVRAVTDYAQRAQLSRRFHRFAVASVSTDGAQVTVTMTATVRMPFLNLISSRYRNGYPVHASATARSALDP